MGYCEQLIRPHHAGFWMWEQDVQKTEVWESASDLLAECQSIGDLIELGVDELPKDCEDIRGRIYNQKGRIFAYFEETGLPYEYRYFAIVEIPSEQASC